VNVRHSFPGPDRWSHLRFDSALSYPEHPALSIRVLDTTVVPAGDEDGYFLRVSVHNSLPCVSAYPVFEGDLSHDHRTHAKPFPASEINVGLSGGESDKLRFSIGASAIAPGISTFRLFCPVCCPLGRPGLMRLTPPETSSWGTYVLEQSEVAVSNLLLQWHHRPAPKSFGKASRIKFSAPTLIRLVKDTHAFDVHLKRPRTGEQVVRRG